jgi:putative transposase
MQLAERHIIRKKHPFYKEIDSIAFLSKNLYNKANYIIRQEFISTSKEKEAGLREHANYLNYNAIQKLLQDSKDVDYYALPTKVSQHVLKLLDKNWKSFFKSIKDWLKHPNKYTGQPSLPRYKHKVKGRNILIYTAQAFSKKALKKGFINPSQTNIFIETHQKKVQQVRIVPQSGQYVVEIVYKKEVSDGKFKKGNVAGIDLGLNNLAAVTSNVRATPQLINGKPLKSINQYYNKKRAKLQSFVPNKSSNKLVKLTNKRNNKINNYMHNSSRYIADLMALNKIEILVIGKNKQWKTEINIGKRNNQAFVNIPHAKFIEMIKYKCELLGIKVICKNESHTSKCSFIDFEAVKHHDKYVGHRRHRGLFISKEKIKINADCNGSGNIVRKVFPNAFADGIEGVVVRPIRVTPYKLAS